MNGLFQKPADESLEEVIESAVNAALVELLQSKHLYQHVQVNFETVFKAIAKEHASTSKHGRVLSRMPAPPGTTSRETTDAFRALLDKRVQIWTDNFWFFYIETPAEKTSPARRELIRQNKFQIPPIKISCAKCKSGPWPHNPGSDSGGNDIQGEYFVDCSPKTQAFALPYLCQNCRSEPVVFYVRREGYKLTLVGRSQFPETIVPNFIPEKQRMYYRNAIIADQTAFTLAAALYLRCVIEQYFYQVIPETEIKAIGGKPTGDELADLYAKSLPKGFPDSFPSLKKAYGDLSAIIHSGQENDETKKSFAQIRTAVDGHFKALQLFKEMPT